MRISDWSSDVCSSDLANVAGRAFARTTHFFMAMVAARLVVSYANPPQMVLKTVAFLFTIAAVFQCAIWAREIILGLVERRHTADESQSLANAMEIGTASSRVRGGQYG